MRIIEEPPNCRRFFLSDDEINYINYTEVEGVVGVEKVFGHFKAAFAVVEGEKREGEKRKPLYAVAEECDENES